jgi:predicted MFS family arabinose efflux permease
MSNSNKVILSRKKIFILGILGFMQGTIFLIPYLSSVFYDPMLEMLGINNAQLGVLMTIYGTITMFGALPGGWLADRFSAKKLLVCSMILTGILGLILAFFMEYTVYCVVWGLLAIVGNIIYWSAAMKQVRFVGDENEQGKTYGYFYAFNFGFNSLLAAVAVAILAASIASVVLGMKFVLIFYSVMSLVAAVFVWKFVASVEKPLAEGEHVIEGEPDIKEKATLKEIFSVFKCKEIWLFSVIAFCCYTMLSISTYFTPYFGDVMGLNVVSAGLIYVITGPGSILFGPIFGTLADWMHSTLKLITILMVVTVGLLLIMIFYHTISLPLAIAIDILIVITGGGAYNIMFSSVEELGLSRKVAGTCIGIASIIAFTPDIFMYVLFGHWLDTYGNDGYTRIFTYSAIAALVAVFIGIYLYFGIVKKRKAEKMLNTTI